MNERNVGTVIQVVGPVLDIKFADGHLPNLNNAIHIEHNGKTMTAEVAQHIGDDVVLSYTQKLPLEAIVLLYTTPIVEQRL